MDGDHPTIRRKGDHIGLCVERDPAEICYGPGRSTLLECVELVPGQFPAVALEEVDTRIPFLSTTIGAPVMVSAITGGSREAGRINLQLAEVCQELRIPLGLGSCRAMLDDPAAAPSFQVRDAAPDIPVVANIGLAQAQALPVERLLWVVEETGADALAVHVNFAMEAVQPEGTRTPAPLVETVARIKAEARFPVIVKEVGTGFTRGQLDLLRESEADWIDVAGAGGTSWVKVEALRGGEEERLRAAPFHDWGVPTAAAVAWASAAGHERIIASGGIRDGLMAAKAMALGARLCGIALPVLRELERGGKKAALAYLRRVIDQLRIAAYLCGETNVAQLRNVPWLVKGELRDWLA